MQPIETENYSIYFNEQSYIALEALVTPGNYSKIVIVADSNTATHCLPVFLPQVITDVPFEIIEIEPGEENKNIDTCVQIWHTLAELEADRKCLIINLGGGMVTDLGGFIASTFKRGVDFINVPTSLLAMVDASIGGKTGVDLGHLKNQVGVINNPVAVLIDTQFLDTLPANEMRSGLAEMLKHGLIADSEYWESLSSLGNLTTDDLGELIRRSVLIKNAIVSQDPYEKSIRKVLNFGHTLGHAIESHFLASEDKQTLLHGEAVAAGMFLESHISKEMNLISSEEYLSIASVINSIFEKIDFSQGDIETIIELLAHDKKNEFGVVNFVVLDGIGNAVINRPVGNELIYNAFSAYKS